MDEHVDIGVRVLQLGFHVREEWFLVELNEVRDEVRLIIDVGGEIVTEGADQGRDRRRGLTSPSR